MYFRACKENKLKLILFKLPARAMEKATPTGRAPAMGWAKAILREQAMQKVRARAMVTG